MNLFQKYASALSAVVLTASVAAVSAGAAAQAAAGPSAADGTHGRLPGRIEMEGLFLNPLQERDSVLIADQLEYGFVLNGVGEGTGLSLPDYSRGFCEGVEVVENWKLDTLAFRKGRKGAPASMDLKASIRITSFDEGVYDLPVLAALRMTPDGAVDTLVFGSKTLDVKTLAVDPETFSLNDIKDQARYPVTFRELLPYIAGLVVLAGLIVLAVWLIRRWRSRAVDAAQKRDPAHIVALRRLEGMRGNGMWIPEKQKAFYSGVTDILREYIVARYGIQAVEMTTAEIFSRLAEKDVPSDLYDEIRRLFDRADFVKFAKYVASDDENSSVVPTAVRFVTQTYQQEIDAAGSAATGRKTDADGTLKATGLAEASGQPNGTADSEGTEMKEGERDVL